MIEGRNPIIMDAKPFVDNANRTMLPVRYISDILSLNTTWDPSIRVAIFKSEGIEVKVAIGSNIITVNGESVEMDTIAIIRDGRTFIPIKYLADAFKVNLAWDNDTKTIEIN